jgi:hypothetical protein
MLRGRAGFYCSDGLMGMVRSSSAAGALQSTAFDKNTSDARITTGGNW